MSRAKEPHGMKERAANTKETKSFRGSRILAISLSLFLGVVTAAAATDSSDRRISPGLLRIMEVLEANRDYSTEIPVILKVDREHFLDVSGSAGELVRGNARGSRANPLGLTRAVTLELIHGYATRVTLPALRGLLRLGALEYATLDLPLQSTSGVNSVADDLDPGTGYDGNDGTQPWTTSWQESGESNGPGSGLLQVVSDSTYCASGKCLYLGDYNKTSGGPWALTRRADLSGATSATLSYNFGMDHRHNEGFLKAQVRSGGGSWTTLETYVIDDNFPDLSGVSKSFDISAHIASDTEVRFLLLREDPANSTSDEVEGYFYIDNIRIDFGGAAGPPSPETVNGSGNPHLASIGLEQTYSASQGVHNVLGYDGTGVTVAVFDSGIANHADIGGGASGVVRDEFNTPGDQTGAYHGSDGSVVWSGPWVEEDDNKTKYGAVRVTWDYNTHCYNNQTSCLKLRADSVGPNIYREVDLSSATSATLSFYFEHDLSRNDEIVLEVSSNGGASYTILKSYDEDTPEPGTDSFDISTYASSNTRIRFRIADDDGGDSMWIDNLQIAIGATESFDFTSGAAATASGFNDGYGHGTHVSGIIGGKGIASGGQYPGIAPGVDFVHLKVIGDGGFGYTSDLIQAIQWTITNKDAYGIRVANLSLGHPAIESYQTDPLCQAVRAMVEAGIVTIVSAGNLGKTSEYSELWGGITSPGTEPSVITVGAVNTRGTATHADDVPTSYSSRGHSPIDGLFKPDLVAPGNRIPAAGKSGCKIYNDYPSLRIDDDYLSMSGSSMATAHVSGVAALLLEANPALTPNLVKAILLMTASKMQNAHPLEQGNGFLNAYGAIKVAEQLDVASQTVLGNVDPRWQLNAENGVEEIWAGGALALGDRVFYTDIADPGAGLWGSGVFWTDGMLWTDTVFWVDGFFWSDSFVWSDAVFWSDSVLWTDSFVWSDSFLWVDSFVWSDGFLWADGFVWSDSLIWSDTTLVPDHLTGDPN